MSGKPVTFTPVDCSVFLDTSRIANGLNLLDSNIMNPNQYKYPRKDKAKMSRPATWIMDAVGSNYNRKSFYLLKEEVNGMKKRVSHLKNALHACTKVNRTCNGTRIGFFGS